ncbi:MAG TPA: class I tRNA ligase family protein [Gemmatimonadaceae bacterium]|nr:class I tRNA ligase family protein [Gemmatimonadaceae bacterium]
MARFYLTTAIDYANGDPHLGHAFEKIGADAIARYRRLCGDKVHFLIGMDEHGQKVAQEATDRGVEPQDLVDDIAQRFQAMWRRLSISNDQFIRTTSESHRAGVRALIERIFEKSPDDFYEKAYEGWYCVGCESFKNDNEIIQGKCILHPTRTLQWVAEKNWFFRLSAYTDRLRDLIANTDFLGPRSRRNEMLALLEQGLEDISASRSRFTWGVPFPRTSSDGETQTTYVWFDALPNYLTATGYPEETFTERWPADLHVIGKDITRFHAIIWPAMLMAANLEVPRKVWAHGFVLLAGDRFSKSAGVKLDLDEAISRFGTDAFRYFLLREVPFDGDGNFAWERFEDRYNSDLANAWGNLASRTISMIERYRGGVVPAGRDRGLDAAGESDIASYHKALDGSQGYMLHEALRAMWQMVFRANEFVDRQAPWKLAKDAANDAELDRTLGALARELMLQCAYLAPFMPAKCEELWQMLGASGSVSELTLETLKELDPAGWRVTKGTPLFPKEDRK